MAVRAVDALSTDEVALNAAVWKEGRGGRRMCVVAMVRAGGSLLNQTEVITQRAPGRSRNRLVLGRRKEEEQLLLFVTSLSLEQSATVSHMTVNSDQKGDAS